MPVLDRLLGWFGQKAMRAAAARLAQQSPTAETAGRALAIFEQNQHKSEVFIDTPAGLARYTRADIDRLRRYARAGVGERVLGQALLGSSVYGYPGGWAQNRLEQVRHYTHWTYAAIDLYCSMVAGLNPSLAYVRSRGTRRERRSELQIGDWRFENVRGALPGAAPQGQSQISNLKSQIRSAKSLHAIKPHEDIEPAQDDHPLLELLRNPNSWDTTWDLFYELILFLRLTGNSYLWVVPNRLGMPCELWVMPSHWVWPRAGQDKLVEFYEIRPFVGQGILRIPAEEIIHFRFKSPLHKIDGYSPLVAAANETDVYESISLSQFYQFKNGSFPMGHLKLGRSYYDPDDRTLERHYAKWRQRFQGEARFGSTLITGDDVEFAPLMVQPKEMAYGESMAMMRDNILALHRVPKELVGLQPSGGDLSWYAPQYAFCRFSLTPLLQMIGQTMTQRLARRYDASLRLWYEDATPDNPAEVRANVSLGLEKGFLSPNEARTYLLGLEAWPNEAADMPWLNPQLAPLPLNQPGTLKDLEADLGGWEKAAGAGQQSAAKHDGRKTSADESANGAAEENDWPDGVNGTPGATRFWMPGVDAQNKGSYFEDCPRDEEGHCKPRGTSDESGKPSADGKRPRRRRRPSGSSPASRPSSSAAGQEQAHNAKPNAAPPEAAHGETASTEFSTPSLVEQWLSGAIVALQGAASDKFAAPFWDTVDTSLERIEGKDWQVHHLFQNNDAFAKRMWDEFKIDIQAPENLRGVPTEIHRKITGSQNAWRAKLMNEMKLKPNNRDDLDKFWKNVKLKDVERFNAEVEAKFGGYFIKPHSKTAAVKAAKKAVEKLKKNPLQLRLLGAELRGNVLKLSTVAMGLLTIFDNVVFAKNIVDEPPQAAAARDLFLKHYEAALHTAENGGVISHNQAMQIIDRFDEYLEALDTPEGQRRIIVTPMRAWIDLNIPGP